MASAPMHEIIIALIIFIAVYAVIIFEKVNRAVIALFGAVLMILAGIFNQEQAIHAIDFNTIGLLTGMMILVGITSQTGFFSYLAIWSAKKAKGDPWKIMMLFCIITAVGSAFLDNVTTVILMLPITLFICQQLKLDPIPYLISEVIFSNIGGTATLIGDPPNIMIGSAAKLDFMAFVVNLAPCVVVVGIATMVCIWFIYGKKLTVDPELKERVLNLKEKEAIKNPLLLKKCLFVVGLTVIAFILHGMLHLEAATVALGGAGMLMLIMGGSHEEVEHALRRVEWVTIFFFLGLFILVHGIEKVGVIEFLARQVMSMTQGDLANTSYFILWLAAIASAIVDNIPFTATMIPLIQDLGRMGMDVGPLWWSLALGACFGGNGTLIGASANVVVAGMATSEGYPIDFIKFLKIGAPLMILSIIIAHAYIWLVYISGIFG